MTTEVLRLGMDTRGMESGHGRATRALSQVRRGARDAAHESDRLTGALDRQGSTAQQLTRFVGALGLAVGAAGLARAIRESTNAATAFESSLTRLNTLVGISETEVAAMGGQIRSLSRDLGISAQEMSEAAFAITSGGARGAEAMEILEQSAKAAAIGLGEARDIGRLAGAAVQAFGDQGLTASRAIDIMVATVREGNLEAAELANVMGSAMGPAAALGVSMEELGGFIATYTRLGVSASEATTSLQAALTLAIRPTEQARAAMAEAGFSVEQFRAAIQDDGLASALVQLISATDGNIDRLGEFIPNVRALRGILGTAGVQGEEFERIVASIGDSMGVTNEGFEAWGQTSEAVFARFQAAVEGARLDFGERFLPLATRGLEGLTDNLDLAADAAVALSTALGGLVLLKVGAWAAAGTTAFVGWAAAAGSLAVGVRTLSGALALLKVAIGPAGWVMLGITAVTGAVFGWRRANRDTADSIDDMADSAGQLSQRLEEQTAQFRQLTDAQLEHQRAAREARAAEIESNIADLESQLAVGAPEGTLDNLQAHRVALEAEQATIERINSLLMDRNTLEGITVEAVRQRGGSLEEELDALRDLSQVMSTALDLDIERQGLLVESLELMGELRSIAQDQTRSLEDRNEAQREFNRLQRSASEHMSRLNEAAMGVEGTIGLFHAELLALPDSLRGTVESMYDLGHAGEDGARTFEDQWLASIHVVGASLGGLASQIANVASAFAMGGPGAGFAALGGAIGGILRGQSAEDEFDRAAREWEDRLDRFSGLFADEGRFARMEADLARQTEELFRSAIEAALADAPRWARHSGGENLIQLGLETLETEGLEAARAEVERWLESVGASAEEIAQFSDEVIAASERLAEQRAQARAQMEDDLQIQLLTAQGRDEEAQAMREEIQRRAELAQAMDIGGEAFRDWVMEMHESIAAANEAAQAEAELAAARRQALQQSQEWLSLEAREAALAGNDRLAMELNLQAQVEAQTEAARQLAEELELGEEWFLRMAAVIQGEANQALQEYEQSIRDAARAAMEAAEAERQRQMALHQRLELEFLRLTGQDAAATALENQIEMERLLAQGADQATLALLGTVQALRAQQEAQREAERGVNRLNDSLRQTADASGPAGFNWRFLQIEAARGAGLLGGGTSGVQSAPRQGQTTTYNIRGVTIQVTGDEEPREVWRKLKQGMVEDAEDGDRTQFRSVEFRSN